MNAYITDPIKEKVWTTSKPEFGNDAGKQALIVGAQYGLKYAGADFCDHLDRFMQGLGYEPCIAKPDLQTKEEVRPDNKYEYYSYIQCYVDDIMVIHYDSLSILKNIDKYFTLKYSLIGDQDIYLGAKRMKITIPNNIWCWRMRPSKYI